MDRTTRALAELRDVVAALRAPGGCPWDQEQKLSDMGRYILEESCEVQDAITDSNGAASAEVCEELGDVLMNIFLASVIAEEKDDFTLADVADGIREKLIRRHPHVFGDTKVESTEQVLSNWNAIKAQEKRDSGKDDASEDRPASRLDGIPRSLPPLAAAFEAGKKAAKCGFDWHRPAPVIEKLDEEIAELRELLDGAAEGDSEPDDARVEEELGDILFSAVNLCRKLGHRPDDALRRATKKFSARFRKVESHIEDLESAPLEEMDRVWNEIKERS